jgi:hypothetical protein
VPTLQQMQLVRVEKVTKLKQRDVNYPVNYERALAALRECENVDECAEWSNQAAAAASYYKQANNCEMEHASERIRLRARLRCGELLNKLDPARREEARERIGIKHKENEQIGDALKVAKPVREAMIDRTPPTTLAKLAKVGNPPVIYAPQIGTGNAAGFAAILAFWKMCDVKKAQDEAAKIDPADAAYVKMMIDAIDIWVGEFETSLPKFKALKAARRA